MKSTFDKLLLVFAWLVLFVVVYGAFGQVIIHPSLTIFQLGGDGVKNYFTFLHHALYDDGAWSMCMNYPYGENIMYLDGQPLLSYIMILLHKYAGVPKHGIVAVLNLTPLLAFLLAVLYTYKIFRHYALTAAWALLFATLTIVMSPQVLRFCMGHYALSYVCIVPMLLYWLIHYDESRKLRYAAYVAMFSTVAVMLHPYYFAISLVLCGFYCVSIFFNRHIAIRDRLYSTIILGIAIAIPAVVVKIYASITDPVTDRPEFPYGFMEYRSHLKDFIASQYSPFSFVFNNRLNNSAEGLGYAGVVVMIICAVMVCTFAWALLKGDRFKPPMPVKWLFVAFASVVCAMAIPFIWGLDNLVEYLGPFKQFRSLGRFAWIFQILVSIYAVVWLYHYCRERLSGKIWQGRIVMLLAVALWSIDAAGYVLFINKSMKDAPECYRQFHYWGQTDMETFLSEHNYKPSDFQAIIAIPFSYVGADKVAVGEDANVARSYAIRASVNTGLPVVNALLARTSWSQAFNMVKTIGGPYTDKPILNMLKSHKPLLLLHHGFEQIHHEDKYLADHSVYIGSLPDVNIYACYPDSILKADKAHRDTAKTILSIMHSSDTVIGCAPQAIYNKRFDEWPTATNFAGRGAYKKDSGISDTVAVWNKVLADDTTQFEFSAWFLFGQKDYRTPELLMGFYDAKGRQLKEERVPARQSTDNHGFWFRASLFFYMPKGTAAIVCRLAEPSDGIRNFVALDEILIKPHKAIYISKHDKGRVLINNHVLIE